MLLTSGCLPDSGQAPSSCRNVAYYSAQRIAFTSFVITPALPYPAARPPPAAANRSIDARGCEHAAGSAARPCCPPRPAPPRS
jgi:hypothetical protein